MDKISDILGGLFAKDEMSSLAVDDLRSDLSGAISTGLTPFDIYNGGGIFPGRIYEFFAEEHQGKTTLADAICAAWQRQGPHYFVHRIETESAMDKVRTQVIGVQMDKMIVSEADLVTEGFERIRFVMNKIHEAPEFKGKDVKILHVWDTIAAAGTVGEKTGDLFAGGISEKPRIIRSGLRSLTGPLATHNNTLILINQVYDMISYTGGVTSPGGRGIRHHASVRNHLKKVEAVTEKQNGKDVVIGNWVELKPVKNKLAMPNLPFKLYLVNETGFQEVPSLIKCVHELGTEYIDFGGGGWTTIKFPEWIPAPHTLKGQGEVAIRDIVSKSRFLIAYYRWLGYSAYAKRFQLMEMKYRHLIWDNLITVINAWNKYAPQLFPKLAGTAYQIDVKKFPRPPEVTTEEIMGINKQLLAWAADDEDDEPVSKQASSIEVDDDVIK
jgi:RecA/RadA recombinase